MPALLIRASDDGYVALVSDSGLPEVTLPGGGAALEGLGTAMQGGWTQTVTFWTGTADEDFTEALAEAVEPYFTTTTSLLVNEAIVFAEVDDGVALFGLLEEVGLALLGA